MKNKKAFTLIELIVVVAIVGVLVAMLAPMASGQIDNAKRTAAKANARTFYSASQSAIATMAAGWETKGSIIPSGTLDITDTYYESGLYRVYFGKDIANKGGLVEPVGTPIDTAKGWVSANETNADTIASPYLNEVKEINKHMALYLGNDNKLVLDKGGYKFVGTGGGTTTPPPTPIVEDDANPANVTLNITKTGKNDTGTFAGREYRLAVSGLTPQAKYQVTIDGTSVGEFTYTDPMPPIDLKGEFTPTTHDVVATHTAQVKVVAVNPGSNFTATKKSLAHDLTFYDGDGSVANPYLICDPESLQMLSHKVKNENVNFGTKQYKQIATIDMSPVANFRPIGIASGGNEFKGTYDGGAKLDGTGYEIINLKIDFPTSEYVGLFGYAKNATISNIGITGDHGFVKGMNFVGSIVGFLNDNCTVRNVYNKVPITASNQVGGIVGYIPLTSSITQAYNTGTVQANANSWSLVGGIVGLNYGSIENVYNTGLIAAAGYEVGGIVGTHHGTLRNAYNTGSVNSNAGIMGGIIGATSATANILNVYNIGNVFTISSSNVAGGVVGNATSNPTWTNTKYKRSASISGTPHGSVTSINVAYTNISEFVNATGNQRSRWNDKGQLLNADGTLMGGPNPGDK